MDIQPVDQYNKSATLFFPSRRRFFQQKSFLVGIKILLWLIFRFKRKEALRLEPKIYGKTLMILNKLTKENQLRQSLNVWARWQMSGFSLLNANRSVSEQTKKKTMTIENIFG